jgi:hypothetical protein
MVVIMTALHEFVYNLDQEICHLVHQESASEDGLLRRFYLQVSPNVNFMDGVNYCISQAQGEVKEIVSMGDLWDIWRNGEDI